MTTEKNRFWMTGRNVLNSVMIFTLCAGGWLLTSCGHGPYVSVGNPKVYGDSQTRMLLDQLQKDVRSNLPSITDSTPQKVSRIQQEYGKLFSFKVEPLPIVPAVSAAGSDTMLRLTPMQFPSAGDETSLGFTQILRERIRRQQDISRHEILYAGDQDFLARGKSLYLIRVDMGLLISKASSDYLLVSFLLKPCSPNGTYITEDYEKFVKNIKIYALAPEYASSLSKDSFLSRGMKELNGALTANIKGFNVTAEGDLEKQLDQYLTSTNETPLQFAIPRPRKFNKTDNSSFMEKSAYSWPEYAFGFGPQRSVSKRSWTNPLRWFGDTYIIENEYIPTVADCYALIVVDNDYFGSGESVCLKLEVNGGVLEGLSGKVDWGDLNKENLGEFVLKLQKEDAIDSTHRLRLLCSEAKMIFYSLKSRLPSLVSDYNAKLKDKTDAMNDAGIRDDSSLDSSIRMLKEQYKALCDNCNRNDEKSKKEKQAAEENLDKAALAEAALEKLLTTKQELSETLNACDRKLKEFHGKHGEEMKAAAGEPREEIYKKYIACKEKAEAVITQMAAALNNDKPDGISIQDEYGKFVAALDSFKYVYFNQAGDRVSPDSIDPSVNSTIVIQTWELPVTPATFVTIDGVMVPSSNTTALGRRMLMATIPASDALQKLPGNTAVDCIVITPGVQECEHHKIMIRKNGDNGSVKAPKAPLSLSPEKGRIGEPVTISSSDRNKYPLSSVKSVLFGNKLIPQGSFLFQSDEKLIFNAPEPDKDIAAAVGVAVLPQLSNAAEMKFTYLVPLTAAVPDGKTSEK